MITNKKMLYTAIILFVASMVLNFPFPHEGPFGETVASSLNLPVQSTNGLQYVGITSLLLFIASLFFLTSSINKYYVRIVLLAILIASIAPSMIVNSFQKTMATGIYAVYYDRDWSNCQFEMVNESTLRGECELPFENYSNKDIQFTIEFYEKHYFADGFGTVSLMNENTPYVVKLHPQERKIVKIESEIDVSNMENHIEGGSSYGVNIIIKADGKAREL